MRRRFFEAALARPGIHTLQHASFLVSALLFWWTVFGNTQRSERSAHAMLSLFTTMVHTGALGALLTLVAGHLVSVVHREHERAGLRSAAGPAARRTRDVGAGRARLPRRRTRGRRALAGSPSAHSAAASVRARRAGRLTSRTSSSLIALARRRICPSASLAFQPVAIDTGTRRARRLSRESRRLRRLPHRRQKRRAVRGRAGDELAVRHDRQQQHHARPAHRHRPLQLRRIRAGDARRRGAGRQAALSGDALPGVRQDHRRRHARALRLHDARRGAGREHRRRRACPSRSTSAGRSRCWDWLFVPHGAYQPRPTAMPSGIAARISCSRSAIAARATRRAARDIRSAATTNRRRTIWRAASTITGMHPTCAATRARDWDGSARKRLPSFLKTGHGGGMVAFGSMVQTVEDSLQYLTDDDLRAIAHYLKSLPATGAADGQFEPRPPAATPALKNACARCAARNRRGGLRLVLRGVPPASGRGCRRCVSETGGQSVGHQRGHDVADPTAGRGRQQPRDPATARRARRCPHSPAR